jgi:hypothetical protein
VGNAREAKTADLSRMGKSEIQVSAFLSGQATPKDNYLPGIVNAIPRSRPPMQVLLLLLRSVAIIECPDKNATERKAEKSPHF